MVENDDFTQSLHLIFVMFSSDVCQATKSYKQIFLVA